MARGGSALSLTEVQGPALMGQGEGPGLPTSWAHCTLVLHHKDTCQGRYGGDGEHREGLGGKSRQRENQQWRRKHFSARSRETRLNSTGGQ